MATDAIWSFVNRLDATVGLPSRRDVSGTDAVLVYHSIGDTGGDAVDPATFRRHLAYLTDRYAVVDLPAVVADETDERRIAITFDDGFADFHEHALPALEAFEVPATLFVSTGLLDDRRASLARQRHELEPGTGPYMLSTEQVADVVDSELVTLGNHTLTHANLERVEGEELRREIRENARRLEAAFGASPTRFSFPYHAFDEDAAAIVRETHELATCGVGLVSAGTEPYRIPRVSAARSADDLEWGLSAVPETLRSLHRTVFR